MPSSVAPWNEWPVELPSAKSELPLFTEYRRLHDRAFHRQMTGKIRANLCKRLLEQLPTDPAQSAVILAGGTSEDFELYDSDTDKTEFRQEMFFRYLFQLNEPDCIGAIHLAPTASGTNGVSILFVPEVTDDSQRWNGTRRPLSWYNEQYGINETYLTNNINIILKEKNIKFLYVLHGQNLDSGNYTKTHVRFAGVEEFNINQSLLHPILCELRLIKTAEEIEVMRIGNMISFMAHTYVMRHVRAGMTEIHCEAMFKSWCQYYGGCRAMAYTCICGSSGNSSILHYGHAGRPNDRVLADGDSMVLDMGGEYIGYATDITRSYPVGGHFNADQAAIHTAVYEASQAVMRAMKPGVHWADMHRLSERVILQHLLNIGLIKGDIQTLIQRHIASVFMPHGLGHLLGLNVHDVGGYLPGTGRDPSPGLCWLRLGRPLLAGMVVTVEPGIYFNDPTLDKALADPARAECIDAVVLKRFRGTGGCRLEDDVLVTENGCENLTVIASTVEEIQQVMQDATK